MKSWNRGPVPTQLNTQGSMFGPGNKPAKTKWVGFRPGLERNRTEALAKNRSAGRFPGPVANTNQV